ncbi:MAG: type II secretion system GspH family protein [Kiritimatiellales bacterium]|nr:type II secretion system GspH family protein [Kiritimatiellales bacterium]
MKRERGNHPVPSCVGNSPTIHESNHPFSPGFTLLEIVVALVVLIIALSIAFQALSATIRGWRRGTEVAESIQHGDFAMEHLVGALRSTVYFNDAKKSYGFQLEKNGSTYPADRISWVTASPAFMPMASPFQHGSHRITLFIDQTDDGEDGLFASARPQLADEEDYEAEEWLVSRGIQGLECRIYNAEEELWEEEYETSNSVPDRIEISLYAAPADEDDDAVVFTRILEIPVAASVKERLSNPTIVKKNQQR